MKLTKRSSGLMLLASLVFVGTICGIFVDQQRRMRQEFNTLILENLASYSASQRRQFHGIVTDAGHTLKSIAGVLSAVEVSAEEPWLDTYLATMNEGNRYYEIQYSTENEIDQWIQQGAEASTAFWQEVQTQAEVTLGFLQMEDQVYFLIAQPILRQGSHEGALWTRLEASTLPTLAMNSPVFKKVTALVVKPEGTILYSSNVDFPSTGNLLTSLSSLSLPADFIQTMKELLDQPKGEACYFQAEGRQFFYSVSPLAKDWVLINFVQTPDVLIRSDHILNSVLISGVILIAATLLLCLSLVSVLFRKRRQLDLDQQRYTMLAQFLDTILFEYDLNQDKIEFTSNADVHFGQDKRVIRQVSKNPEIKALIHLEDFPPRRRYSLQQLTEMQEQIFTASVGLRVKDGSFRQFACQYKWVFSEGELVKMIGKLTDITGHYSREQQLLKQAQRDVLTQLYNKAGEDAIEAQLKQDPRGILIMADLDNFKEINDRYGHAAGDQVLKAFADILKRLFRSEDILMRTGGDEFIMFIHGLQEPGLGKQKARQILDQVQQLHFESLPDLQLTASLGVARSPGAGTSARALIESADQAMYASKEKGKGNVTDYAEMNENCDK
ncbi:GGDEF domain-containing protein [Holdemania massiliensis]|uniref:GGDEF domain-containing protein n=1 Tax=Holdemania massiliensis TaxID=1468449 RepID=UPI001F05E1D6|nr:GGDEF domain-containing protein [Holdemania massiliensis]MCH1940574.1 GGDEF domain-containing protein [Holdemania massiliensis]